MKSSNIRQKLITHGIVFVSFLILTFAYMSPLLKNEHIKQQDVTQYKGMSREVKDFKEKTGETTFWTNTMFSGMPTYQITGGYPFNMFIIGKVNTLLTRTLPKPANVLFLYLLSFYILLLVMDMGVPLSIIGAIAFAFASNHLVSLQAGHMTKTLAMGLAPLVFAGIVLTMKKRQYLMGTVLASLFLAFEIAINHPQITYYLGIFTLIYMIHRLIFSIKEKDLKHYIKGAGLLALAALLAIGANFTKLALTYEYSKATTRGKSDLSKPKEAETGGLDKDYVFRWSYGIGETGTLLIPDFRGGSSMKSFVSDEESKTLQALRTMRNKKNINQIAQQTTQYWGEQPFTSGPVYVGAIICFLFILGIFLLEGKTKWWLVIAAVLSIMLAWGKNFMSFNELFFYYFPLYNKFRTVTMALFIAELAIPILAVLTLKKILDHKPSKEKVLKAIRNAFIITGGFCLIFALIPDAFLSFIKSSENNLSQQAPGVLNALQEDRNALLRTDAFRSFIFIVLGAGILFLYWKQSIKIPKRWVLIITGALILIDLWAVDKRYLNEKDFTSEKKVEQPIRKTSADRLILRDNDPNFRVLNLNVSPFNDATTSYHHRSIGGYHGAKLQRYQELIEFHISDDLRYLQRSLGQGDFVRRSSQGPVPMEINPSKTRNIQILNMLNMKYLILAGRQGELPVLNPGRLGNAWVIKNLKKVKNADEEIRELGKIDPATEAVFDQRFESHLNDFELNYDPNASIELTKYEPNVLVYRYKASRPQFVVFSEVYYNDNKGWKAYIDGKHKKHIRVNYVLRGMTVPAGEHTIRFEFDPPTFHKAEPVSLASSLIILLLTLGALGYKGWKWREKSPKGKKENA